jgi:cytoskeletal protein CcmA (bactofilin family)
MSETNDNRPEANTLYIGEKVAIRGASVIANAVVVDGLLEGDISVGNLLVSETGTIRGKIHVAQDAEIFGHVFERLDVKGLLILHATSRADGNITSGNLKIERGASITGGICSSYHRPAKATAKPSSKAERKHEAPRVSNLPQTLKPLELPAVELVPLPGPVAASA